MKAATNFHWTAQASTSIDWSQGFSCRIFGSFALWSRKIVFFSRKLLSEDVELLCNAPYPPSPLSRVDEDWPYQRVLNAKTCLLLYDETKTGRPSPNRQATPHSFPRENSITGNTLPKSLIR